MDIFEFEVKGVQYRSTKIPVKQQLHIARRLGPVILKLDPGSIKGGMDINALLGPAILSLAEMSEADCDYVVNKCMAVVRRSVGGNWAKIYDEQADQFMYQDIDLPSMIEITMRVLGDNLANFTNAPASTSIGPSQPGLNTHQMGSLNSQMGRVG